MPNTGETRGFRIHDWVNLILGLSLFLTPWIYSYTGIRTAAIAAWATGAVIALVAATALWRFAEWEEWVVTALGAWTVAAPFVLGFRTVELALQAFLLVGVLLAVSSLLKLWSLHHSRQESPMIGGGG